MHNAVADLFLQRRMTVFGGPCVIESPELCLQVAQRLREVTGRHGVSYVFKASFDKANRTSLSSFRGPGLAEGLKILAQVKADVDVPVVTDIHTPEQAAQVAEVADVIQIPAFLSRQTDLLVEAARTGRPTFIKKGQFMAADDMRFAVEKFRGAGGEHVALGERGTSFGYRDLVVDFRNLVAMSALDVPVIFDATHSVQKPSASGGRSGGDRRLVLPLSRAAVAVGVDGLFCEVHPRPDEALSDGPNSLNFEMFETLMAQITALHSLRDKGWA